jgi:hypothetical protein
MINPAGEGHMDDPLVLEKLISSDVYQTCGLPHTFSRGQHTDISRAETTVDGLLENPERTAFYELGFNHETTPFCILL